MTSPSLVDRAETAETADRAAQAGGADGAAPAASAGVRYPVRPSPVDADVELAADGAARTADAKGEVITAVTTVAVEESEPVFEGHYPGFPIFPGVCLVECVRRSALAAAERFGLPEPRLLAVESTRFLGSVHPGDRITVRLDLRDHDGAVRCRAKVTTVRGDAASVRLRLSGRIARADGAAV